MNYASITNITLDAINEYIRDSRNPSLDKRYRDNTMVEASGAYSLYLMLCMNDDMDIDEATFDHDSALMRGLIAQGV